MHDICVCEIGLTRASVASIQQLEQKTDMIVMHGGLHGHDRTTRFMDLLLENMDSTHQGHIDYRSILSGEVFSEHTRRRPSRGFHLLDRARLADPDSDEDRK
ncbi:hypothetical protein RRG08_049190 [Elysia crispata]|uniref:Uncharacterized protein n=1 Tax=Elysia crispata TaxID=231223 RepID=A0AAE0YQY8_9GAST|nr:hypothetical protein RRG08_049190 [Elysia crispata]